MEKTINTIYSEIKEHLEEGLIPFWLSNSIDKEHGGYQVIFDANGKIQPTSEKMIVTQTRMIWGFSHLYRKYKDARYLQAAKHGVDYFVETFWDKDHGGWYWKIDSQGEIDQGKVLYGQVFAIYALSEYTLATGEAIGIDYAEKTFDLIQKYCTDTHHGGYYENFEADWSLSDPGFHGGDLKSLDIHMHIMEAFTTLYEYTQKEIHRRKLEEVIALILDKMINADIGCGYNQFDLAFNRQPAINIRRTWNSERKAGEELEEAVDSTSYGHNCELIWLLNRALDVLGVHKEQYIELSQAMVDHTLKYGFDTKLGGVFRDGPHEGAPLIKDKEWWQNSEVLVGFLDVYELTREPRYLEAFIKTWQFVNQHMINHEVGEWRQLLSQDGQVIIGDVGNPWKAIYHTGRSMLECKERLERLLVI